LPFPVLFVASVDRAQWVIEVAVWYHPPMKCYSQEIYRAKRIEMRISMIGRLVFGISVLVPCVLGMATAYAQDVPGIEICTVEKTMERRTSCLQSNVEFLQKTVAKLSADHQQKLDAAKAQIEALKASLVGLQKVVEELKAAQAKTPDVAGKKVDTLPKDTAAKETTKDAAARDGAAKEGGK
jgi:hypothetical protein